MKLSRALLLPTLRLLALLAAALGLASPAARGQAGAPGPTVRVSGTVSMAGSREPIPGASVIILRTHRGVAANAQGDFLITALATDTILFRAIGFKPHQLVLGGTTLSQLVVQITLTRNPVELPNVQVTADRPDRALINRALRNIKRPPPPVVKIPRKAPRPKPLFQADTTGPKYVPPTVGSPISLLYDQFSRAGKQRRKMEQLKAQEAAEKARQARAQYNKAFKDNRGYE